MAHRRKNSHPVCKTRRNFNSNWEILQGPPSDEEENGHDQEIQRHTPKTPVSMETVGSDGQQIVIPPDLFKDFEAVRSQTKMDATDLMRRLLRDYQGLASSSDKTLTSPPSVSMHTTDDHTDADLTGAEAMAKKASIATDVSLATARVDTDEDEFQGLDLSVRSRKISSKLFDTKSLNSVDEFDKPLDLSCSKTAPSCEVSNRDSPSSSHMELAGVHNEFNYVYVYPGLYPPGSGMLSQDDIDSEPPKESHSPVPDLIPQDQLSPSDSSSRSQYVSAETLENNFALNPNLAYNAFMSNFNKTQFSPKEMKPPSMSPSLFKQEPLDIDTTVTHRKHNTMLGNLNKAQFPPNEIKPPSLSPSMFKQDILDLDSPVTQKKQGRSPRSQNDSISSEKPRKEKKNTEMKVISENTTYPGVYTSVMKLPWSRRTRTKKPKHKLKLEDTLIPQFMLEENQALAQEKQISQNQQIQQQVPPPTSQMTPLPCNPETSQSCMMVYPNAGSSALGKPVRKRGRPPKLPMLAKLLQNQQQQGKRSRKEKKVAAEMQAKQSETMQLNDGLTVFNAEGQTMNAYGGIPLPVTSSTESVTQQIQQVPCQPLQGHMIPNMAQAQFIGQFPLSQVTGGQIQFLGQFPAHAVPGLQGQPIQAIPMQLADAQIQQMIAQGHLPKPMTTETKGQEGDSSQQDQNALQTVNYQYAMQPMFIPTPVPVSVPPQQEINKSPGNESKPEEEEVDSSPASSPTSTLEQSPEVVPAKTTHVMKNDDTNTISTMSTTSIANTGTGAIYQEMILSSKSLVDVKKRRRQTAIQLLKSKSSDQNFLCTSFRIRPRLVAQAQAQRERMAAKGEVDEIETDSKNLIRPQNDNDHFGDTIEVSDTDGDDMKIKHENGDESLSGDLKEYDDRTVIKPEFETEHISSLKTVIRKQNSAKKFMLKGSQKRKAKSYRNVVKNLKVDSELIEENGSCETPPSEEGGELFQELFNCKVCNKIIPVKDMDAHSLEHLQKKSSYHCNICDIDFEESGLDEPEEFRCESCNEVLERTENQMHGHGKISCDECPETFKSLPEFYEHKTDEHKRQNETQNEFECDICGKVYQYYHALQFHRRTHRERRVPCLDKSCGLKFRSRKEMENHFDAKHPDKKEYYHCIYDGCTKKFLKNFHLQEHIRVKHYNIKAFQCPWPGCVKEFAARRHLKIHLLIHRDEKPMKCDHCDYRCRQRSAMNWHMRKHPDVPYKYKRAPKSPTLSAAESE